MSLQKNPWRALPLVWLGTAFVWLATALGCGDTIQIVQPREGKSENSRGGGMPHGPFMNPGTTVLPGGTALNITGTFLPLEVAEADKAGQIRHSSGLTYLPGEAWVEETPEGTMRAAQYSLPPAEGDTEAASIVVLFLGVGEGGGLDASIARWCSWFKPSDGRSGLEAAKITEMKSGELTVTRVEVTGAYTPPQTGMGETGIDGVASMIGAVIEGAGGPWYIRCIGQEKTVAHWSDEVDRFIRTVRHDP